MKYVQVACAVIEQDGLIFAARRKIDKSQGGLWEFPGGKLETNENAQEALMRELTEELSIHCEIMDFIAENQYDYGSLFIHLQAFRTRWKSGTLSLTDHDCSIWLPPWQLFSLQWAPADIEIVKHIMQNSHPK